MAHTVSRETKPSMEKAEVNLGMGPDPLHEMEVQNMIPLGQRRGWIGDQIQMKRVSGEGDQLPEPNLFHFLPSPKPGEGGNKSGVPEPSPGFPMGGGALIGEKSHKPPLLQVTMGHSVAFSIVEDRCPMVGSNVPEKNLTERVVCGSSQAEGVASQGEKDAGEPLPIAVMHGEENGSLPFGFPSRHKCLEW